jgi:hypothetical protein
MLILFSIFDNLFIKHSYNNKKKRKDYYIVVELKLKNDNFIFEYVNDDGIFLISYEVNELLLIK